MNTDMEIIYNEELKEYFAELFFKGKNIKKLKYSEIREWTVEKCLNSEKVYDFYKTKFKFSEFKEFMLQNFSEDFPDDGINDF